jgi:putative methyltransferase (TIGR04325 family)
MAERLKARLGPLWQRLNRTKSKSTFIWSGIYSSFDQVPRVGQDFDGQRFAQETLRHTRQLLDQARSPDRLPMQTSCHDSLLPMLVSLVADKSKVVRILDFGGGTGAAFVNVVSSLPSCDEIRFDVVETASACELGRELFDDEPRIRFHTELPNGSEPIDIVHISSALQYIKDYRKILVDLCSFQATYFLLVNLSAAAIPTYATAQRVYNDMIVPYWFLNMDEVIDILASEAYGLCWTGFSQREFDQSNFPLEYRMGRTCNLLFRQDGTRN